MLDQESGAGSDGDDKAAAGQTSVDALVTGATGFIGGHLVRALLKRGQAVRVLVRPGSNRRALEGLPVQIVEGSLEDAASLRRGTVGARAVYNCAGLSSDWAPRPKFEAANVNGVAQLLRAVEDAGGPHLVHLSTSDVYGYPKRAGDETQQIRDVGLPYNRSKVAGERLVQQAIHERRLPITVLRPATVYGPGAKDWVIEVGKAMLQKQMLLLDGGRSPAGLVYVDNLVQAMMAAPETPAARGRTYNIRDAGQESWAEYVNALGQGLPERKWGCIRLPSVMALGVAITLEAIYRLLRLRSRPLLTRHAVFILSRDQCFGIDRACRELDFRSAVSFAEGMERTRSWLGSPEGREAMT